MFTNSANAANSANTANTANISNVLPSRRSAWEIHRELLAAVAAWEHAEHNAVVCFAEVLSRRLYQELGYTSIQQYARVELKFSDSRTGDFVRLARRLAELPVLRAAVADGSVGYTKAREIITVASSRTEAQWVATARSQSRSALAAKVKQVRQKAARRRGVTSVPGQLPLLTETISAEEREVPVRVCLEMTPEQYVRYEALVAGLAGAGAGNGDRIEALLQGLAGTVSRLSEVSHSSYDEATPRGVPPVQVVIHQCPTCDEAVLPTNRGELPITQRELARLKEDAQVLDGNGRNISAIPPALRLKTLARDRHRCAAPGCRHTHFLHVHHRLPREQGGRNELDNLVTLCAGCHRLLHRRQPAIRTTLAPRR
jgi:5-methylcytosine-specific restriction endonuclease McrA